MAHYLFGPIGEAEAFNSGEFLSIIGGQDCAPAHGGSCDQQVHWTDQQPASFQIDTDSSGFERSLTIKGYLLDISQESGNNFPAARRIELERSIFDFVGGDARNGELPWRCVLEPGDNRWMSPQIVDQYIGVEKGQRMGSRAESFP